MKTIKQLWESLYVAWAIASKDIVDALKNRNTFINIILTLGIVAFFYWGLAVRPFDKRILVVVYDESNPSLDVENAELADGYKYTFYQAISIQDMKNKMRYRNLGLVIPADFLSTLEKGGEGTLYGYIHWVDRAKVSDLEARYTQQFSELLGKQVNVIIGENIVEPRYDNLGNEATAAFHMLFGVFYMAAVLVPFLMLEEQRSKTIEALLVSPVSAGQLVMGKALAGLFYMALSATVTFILNRAFIIEWGLAFLVTLCSALFSVLLALVVGGLIKSLQQVSVWGLIIMLVVAMPGLFSQEANLTSGFRALLTWLPSVALTNLFRYCVSVGVPPTQILFDFGVALIYIVILFSVVVWQVRRFDQ